MSVEAVRAVLERAGQSSEFRLMLWVDPLAALSDYDLTEEEKDFLIVPNFRWVVGRSIAGVSFPRSEATLAVLWKKGIRALLSLTESAVPADALAHFDFEVEHIPVADLTAPSLAQVEQAISSINGFVERDLPVAVHCMAGIGRTGTVLACYLVSRGMSSQEALKTIRAQQPGSVETVDQEAVVEQYERLLRQRVPTK